MHAELYSIDREEKSNLIESPVVMLRKLNPKYKKDRRVLKSDKKHEGSVYRDCQAEAKEQC
jgi:hypothetical protein